MTTTSLALPVADVRLLSRFAYLAVAAALATIALKTLAWRLTGSAGLLSDALESVVNLAAAVLAVVVLRWSAKPPDDEHTYGHAKAEYVSAGAEGAMILIAAASIAWIAIERLISPAPLQDIGIGLVISVGASLINLAVGLALLRAGGQHRSVTLEADGRHLLTDVWTSIGVVVGVAAAALTGWERLDPIIALAVAVNIIITGVGLVRRFTGGLLDRALPEDERAAIQRVLDDVDTTVRFHALRTRQAGRRSFASVHVLVPGDWTVQRGHDLLERVEAALRDTVPGLVVFTHLEPLEDPASHADADLDRTPPPADADEPRVHTPRRTS
ncbi:MAG: cation diffusion facilitator family transporter [Solirubrobacteraceae bacterium]